MLKSLTLMVLMATAVGAADLEDAWLKAVGLETAGRSEEAMESFAEIERRALDAGRYGLWMRAFAAGFRLLPHAMKIDAAEALPVFADFARKVPAEARPAANLAMAHFLWEYYTDNRSAIDARGESVGDGISRWNRRQFVDAVFDCFGRVLADAQQLKKTPARDYPEVLAAEEGIIALRPSLYDRFLHDMIAFCGLSLGERGEVRHGDVFCDAEKFMRSAPSLKDADAPLDRALALFAELLNFHRGDKDLLAFAACDLDRLRFCARFCRSAQDRRAYASALDQYIAKWRRFEVSAVAAALRVRLAADAEEFALAGVLAARAIAAFPGSAGAAECRRIVKEMERPVLELSLPRVWNAKGTELSASYKNLNAVYFRMIALPDARMMMGLLSAPDAERMAESLARSGAGKSWAQILPPSVDNTVRKYDFAAAGEFRPGFYLLQASTTQKFDDSGKGVWLPVTVGDFSMAVKSGSGTISGVLTERRSGEPVSKGRISLWSAGTNGVDLCRIGSADDEGRFVFRCKAGRYMLLASKNGISSLSDLIDHAVTPDGRPEQDQAKYVMQNRHAEFTVEKAEPISGDTERLFVSPIWKKGTIRPWDPGKRY